MIVVGVDEVGRGCLAGPLVAGAVVLRRRIPGLKDSKLLTRSQREILTIKIQRQALAVGLGWVGADIIDKEGLTVATRLAMEQALEQITIAYDEIIIDGKYNFLRHFPTSKAVIKADNSIAAVSAASIIAKVARDQYMAEQAIKYPDYGFERHVGYGTALHLDRLNQFGASQLHRRSFAPVMSLLELSR